MNKTDEAENFSVMQADTTARRIKTRSQAVARIADRTAKIVGVK